jgi:hypothetical protein
MKETRADQIQAAFQAFALANPHVQHLFNSFSLEMVSAGRKHFSAKAVVERIRWETALQTTDPEVKINNNWTCLLARRFEALNPHLKGFFRNRKLVSKDRPAVEPDRQFFLTPLDP